MIDRGKGAGMVGADGADFGALDLATGPVTPMVLLLVCWEGLMSLLPLLVRLESLQVHSDMLSSATATTRISMVAFKLITSTHRDA
jgi:hypothetical protein